MNSTRRPHNSESDLTAILALSQVCTTPQTLYDRPTTSDLRRLVAQMPGPAMTTKEDRYLREKFSYSLRYLSSFVVMEFEHLHRMLRCQSKIPFTSHRNRHIIQVFPAKSRNPTLSFSQVHKP
jgi:hypothetical protein